METLESEATIVDAAMSMQWSARYEFEGDYSPSAVVANAIRTQITNFF
jgi:UDP-N-acetylglucosamine 2-epimerase (non-hydrolysing)